MLAYILALAVGLGSFSIYMAAFFFPEVHRKSDFAWSGVGLFYALVLWACAGRITGALLLGQMAGVALLGWFGWQTLVLRRQVTPVAQQTPIPESAANLQVAAAGSPIAGWFGKKQEKEPAPKKPKFVRSKQPKTDAAPAPVPPTAEVKLEEQPPVPPAAEPIAESSIVPEVPAPEPASVVTEAVFVAETPAQTPLHPPESTPSSEPPLTSEISEIASEPVLEPAEPQTEVKQQPAVGGFEPIAPETATVVKESQPTSATSAPDAKVAKKSSGFGGLFGNFKNSLSGLLGGNSGKNKPPARPPATPSVAEKIAPDTATPATPAPESAPVQASELTPSETESAAAAQSEAVPFPPDVAAMAELVAGEKAKVQESEDDGRSTSPTDAVTRPEALERPQPTRVEPSTTGEIETQIPAPPLETVIPEVVFAPPAEEPGPGDPSDRLETDASATVVDVVTEGAIEPSEPAESQLIRPNPPTPDLVEAAGRSEESKSENAGGESKPSP